MPRIWTGYFTRVFEGLDQRKKSAGGVTAIATLAGTAIAGPVGATVGALGTGVFFVGLCALKAWPELLTDAKTLIGNKLKVEDLEKIHPRVRRIGSIGMSYAGKTTLHRHILSLPGLEKPDRTEEIYAMLGILPIADPLIYALIDGAGQQYGQQFKIFDQVEGLIVCLDHSSDDNSSEIDQTRLDAQRDFMRQMLGHIKTTKNYPKNIHFLLNKRDRWQHASNVSHLREWFSAIVHEWTNLPSTSISHAEHCNFESIDQITITRLIATWLGR